jgi:hypothetical protein
MKTNEQLAVERKDHLNRMGLYTWMGSIAVASGGLAAVAFGAQLVQSGIHADPELISGA